MLFGVYEEIHFILLLCTLIQQRKKIEKKVLIIPELRAFTCLQNRHNELTNMHPWRHTVVRLNHFDHVLKFCVLYDLVLSHICSNKHSNSITYCLLRRVPTKRDVTRSRDKITYKVNAKMRFEASLRRAMRWTRSLPSRRPASLLELK